MTEVNKKILIDLESKPYKLIECLLDEETSLENLLEEPILTIKIREYLGNKLIKIIEQKKVSNINDFYDYVNELSDKYSSQGFINADRILNSKYVNVLTHTNIETYVKVRFIEDEIGFLLKEEGGDCSIELKTVKYIEVFNKVIPFYLSTDKTFNNLDKNVRESFKFFIDNQFKVIDELKLWYWSEWLPSEFYDDAMEYEIEKENRIEMMFDEGFDEYLKKEPSWEKHKNVYEDLKEISDKYFRLDIEIKNAKSNEDKIKVVDQILSIDFINVYNSDIEFYFDYFLYDHGFGIRLENRNTFDICN